MNFLALERPIGLIVHDWGGMIGFAWAKRHVASIGRLVIMNTAAFPMPAGKRLPKPLALVRNSALGAFLVLRCNAFAAFAARLAPHKPLPARVRRAYTGPYDSPAHRIATLRFVQDIPLSPSDPGFDILLDTAEHLSQFRNLPCLIAWGEKDFVFDQDFLRTWQELFPRAERVSHREWGHYVLVDAGTDLVARIETFLDRTEGTNHGSIRD